MTRIHHFRHHAMATYFEVRIANVQHPYAAEAAQAALDRIDALEASLSRFRPLSEVSRVAALEPGSALRLSEETFACLAIAKRMEHATRGAFSATPAALQRQSAMPRWSLSPNDFSIRCDSGRIDLDLGAVGKGFALDRVADLLRLWECPSFLLVAGGSSVLAGDGPSGVGGWSCGLGDDDAPRRLLLAHASLSGSGLAVKGSHILDPRTGQPILQKSRTWALCDSAAESDAVSTAAMILNEDERTAVLASEPSWLILLPDGDEVRTFGSRSLPKHG